MKPVEVVRNFYDLLGRGDVDAAVGVLADSIEWTEAESFPYSSGTWTGPKAVYDNLFIPLGRDWENFAADPESMGAGQTHYVDL